MYAIIFIQQAMVSGAGIIALVNEAVAIQIRRHGRWFEQEKCIRTGKRSNDRSVLPEEETCLVVYYNLSENRVAVLAVEITAGRRIATSILFSSKSNCSMLIKFKRVIIF